MASTIHMYVGEEILRGTKTACSVKLEDLPREDGSVPYRNRQHVTCSACRAKADRIENMRSDMHK